LLTGLILLLLLFAPVYATVPTDEAAKLLPDQVNDVRAQGAAQQISADLFKDSTPEDFGVLSAATRIYGGGRFQVTLIKTRSDSNAYAFLTNEARKASPPLTVRQGYVGIAAIDSPGGVTFVKGPAIVRITAAAREAGSPEATLNFARLFAERLDKGDGDIPVLVRHLPDWEKVQGSATYAVSQAALRQVLANHPVSEVVSFEGGAEAVTAAYGQSRLVIVENTTPQLATDNDARIQGRIRQLREQGQSVPTAYQRVGNYSVLVFDAPDEQTAAQLIKAISYEQTVQWLGNNPRALERAQRQYTETTANIIVSVLKASGLSILLCLGVGGLFGGLVFRHRRAQQAASTSYSDAGDMVRLNIDGMTAQNDPARLLGRGDG
jgi:hypothetical protein